MIVDRLEAMSTLVAVVEAGSLSAASRKLGMPLATVSRKLSELEAHLKIRLVHRTNRQLRLTDAGRSYIAACKRILNDIGDAERAAAGEYIAPKGDLMITAPIVFGRTHLLPVVTEFLRAYTEINIRTVFTDDVVNLLKDDVDVAVRIGELPDSSLIATRVGSVRLVICGSPTYFAQYGKPKSPGDLKTHRCITFDRLMAPGEWTFARDGSVTSVAIQSRLIVNTAEAAIEAAVAGLGVTRVLSYQVEPAIRLGTLAAVLRKFEPAARPVSLVHSGYGPLPLKLRAFLDFAAPRLKAQLVQGQS